MLKIPPRELHFSFARSGGKGGQNVNKLNTKAILKWSPLDSSALRPLQLKRFLQKYENKMDKKGFLTLSSQRFRDQSRNIADALQKLEHMIEEILPEPKRRKKTKPPKAVKEKRLQDKKKRGNVKSLRKPPSSE